MRQIINDKGIEYLRHWIIKTTKIEDGVPYCNTDNRALNAWAEEAEESLAAGNGAHVEMDCFSTESGRPETFVVPADGIRIEYDN